MNSTYASLEVPEPILQKNGEWPWGSSSVTNTYELNEGQTWPRVTVVTPSFNQADYLEETIRSVLLQGYPNLEYIIIDGGSTDGSVDIIKHYESHLAYWVSEPDSGQANAINKGWQRATGEYMTWLNSDDLLLPGSLFTTVSALVANKELDIVYGNAQFIDSNSVMLPPPYDTMYGKPWSLSQMIVGWWNPAPQQGFLMRRELLDKIGYLDESYHFTMDFEYWVRIAVAGGQGQWIKKLIASFRQHPDAKTSNMQLTLTSDKFRVYEKIFETGKIPAGYEDKSIESKANLHYHGIYNSYLADNSKLMREHLRNYLSIKGRGAFSSVWRWIILSRLSNRGLVLFRNTYRRGRKIAAAVTS
ncbi:MAG: glycosyltransferase family 2 protein [Chloroflexota bacterium]